MLIMRVYALYERSRKVLSFYTVIAVIFSIVGVVSHDLVEMNIQPDTPFLILLSSGRYWVEKKKNLSTYKYM